MRTLSFTALAATLAVAACSYDDVVHEAADATATNEPDATSEADTADAADTSPDVTAPGQVVQVHAPDNWNTDPTRTPRNVHMTWQGDPATTISFAWTTNAIDLEAYAPRIWIVPSSEVVGGAMPWAEAWVAEGTGMTYKESLLGRELGDETYVVWEAEMAGLQPRTEYTYRVGSWESFDPETGSFTDPDLSETGTFTTGLSKGSRAPFQFMMAGDSRGGSEEIDANIGRLVAMDTAMWFFNGDMTQGGTQPEWDTWFTSMKPLLDDKVLMPVQGNHEIFANLYYAQYPLPRELDLPEQMVEHAWSIDYGNVHFVGLDSNTEAAVEDQVAWLDGDLAAARADEDVDWIVVMFHHPAYSASNHGSTTRVQDGWVEVFEEHDVDLVFAGHDHDYERTHPIRGEQVVDEGDGVVYVVAGAFYSPGYSNGTDWWTHTSAHGDLGNYVHISVDGKSIHAKAYTGDGNSVLDEFTLTRP